MEYFIISQNEGTIYNLHKPQGVGFRYLPFLFLEQTVGIHADAVGLLTFFTLVKNMKMVHKSVS